jgi:peptidoglycan L-alanyl-D-glutamate endopeptidase CwlK
MYNLSNRSLQRLSGVHPDLAAVVKRAIQISKQDFFVGEGVRSMERQKKLVASGASKTMNSRHLTGHAVDLHPYPYDGDHDSDGVPNRDDWDAYRPIVDAMQRASEELKIDIDHGWDWGWDAPHHQLTWETYPKGR